jgi:hypothetical protein
MRMTSSGMHETGCVRMKGAYVERRVRMAGVNLTVLPEASLSESVPEIGT